MTSIPTPPTSGAAEGELNELVPWRSVGSGRWIIT